MPLKLLDRIRAHYCEMPGIRLSPWQIARLCAIDDDLCCAALDALVRDGFLVVTAGGMYVHPREHPGRRKVTMLKSRLKPRSTWSA